MAHSTRLFIVDELSKKEKCVCELQKMIGDDFSTVSKHLTILKNAGIVLNNKRGNQVFYKIDASCASKIICCADNVIKAKLKKETLISQINTN
jgi:ArsR family transcriptional regulator